MVFCWCRNSKGGNRRSNTKCKLSVFISHCCDKELKRSTALEGFSTLLDRATVGWLQQGTMFTSQNSVHVPRHSVMFVSEHSDTHPGQDKLLRPRNNWKFPLFFLRGHFLFRKLFNLQVWIMVLDRKAITSWLHSFHQHSDTHPGQGQSAPSQKLKIFSLFFTWTFSIQEAIQLAGVNHGVG